MIFELALCQAGGSLGYAAVTDRTSPPMVVSQVCKLWRDVALRNSKLWCFPRIVIRAESTEELSSQQDLFKLFVERSHSQTLALRIVNGPHSKMHTRSPGHRQLLAQVSKSFPRCSYFEIHVQFPLFIDLLSEIEGTTTTWSNLTHLSICSNIFEWYIPPLELFSHAPKLNYLELNVGTTRGLGNIHLPYYILGVFRCQIPLLIGVSPAQAVQDWQELVWKCVNAHSLSLNLTKKYSIPSELQFTPFQPTKTVALKKVTSVSIVNDFHSNADLLLSAFTFPFLHTFSFEFARASYFLPKSKTVLRVEVPSYFNLTKHFKSITALTLLRVSIEDDDLLELFKSAPGLTYLNLLNLTNNAVRLAKSQPGPVIQPNDKHLVHLLSTMTATSHEDEGSFLPYLTSLGLYYPYEAEGSAERVEAYASMAKARARMNSQVVEPSPHRVGPADPETRCFEFFLSFREGIKTAGDIGTVTTAMDGVNLEPPYLHFQFDILPSFDKVPEGGSIDECLRMRH